MKFALWALLVALAGPASAQTAPTTAPPPAAGSGPDWDLRQDARAKLTVAFVAFDNGLAIGARCTEGAYEVAIAGLPAAASETRTLKIGFGGEPAADETWYVATDPGTAISSFPAPFARRLRAGGRMDLVVPGGAEGGRNLRYVLTLPASGAAIDQSLAACDRPLTDSRDARIAPMGEDGLPTGLVWRVPPRRVTSALVPARGFAALSCLIGAEGQLTDCVTEAQYPSRIGLGQLARRLVSRARMQNEDGPERPIEPRMINFTMTFCVENYCPRDRPQLPTGSRLPVTSPDG
jgi:hypothetical protein